jgi:hypothetical protein
MMLIDSQEDKVNPLSKKLMNVGENDMGDTLRNMELSGATMKMLRDNRHVNFMLNYCRAPINNYILKFMIKSRAGLTMTPERKFRIGFSDEVSRRCSCERE